MLRCFFGKRQDERFEELCSRPNDIVARIFCVWRTRCRRCILNRAGKSGC